MWWRLLENALKSLALEMLVDLLKAYSPSGHEEKAIKILHEYASILGFDKVYTDDAGNLIAELGYGEKSIALVGHIDTIPGELPVIINNDAVAGRGAVDAKGPLIAMFIGASLAKKHIDLDKFRVYAIAVIGEEGDSKGARELIKKGFKSSGIIIGEPSNNSIVLGYRGSMKVRIKCSSSPSHASSPPLESPACDKLIDLWIKIREKYSIFEAELTTATLLFMQCGDSAGYTIYPHEGSMYIDFRVGINDTIKSIDEYLKSLITHYSKCYYDVSDYTQPIKTSVNNTIVRALTRAIIMEGKRPRFVYKLGTSDMNLLYSCTSNIVAYGPGKSELSHTDKEEITVEEILYGAKVYRNAIKEFFKLISS
jgi:LysW-gamma-L-lysine carboxypeptidase